MTPISRNLGHGATLGKNRPCAGTVAHTQTGRPFPSAPFDVSSKPQGRRAPPWASSQRKDTVTKDTELLAPLAFGTKPTRSLTLNGLRRLRPPRESETFSVALL
jgi:hypothetical protein